MTEHGMADVGGAARSSKKAATKSKRQPSLAAATALSLIALLFAGIGVVYLLGRPWANGLFYIGDEPLPWKERLLYAGGVVTLSGAVVALVVNYRRQRDAESSRFTAAFGAAATHLGDPAPAVRIAGVYALAAVADTHAEQRQQCIDALCGYLRLPYDPVAGAGHLTERSTETPGGNGIPKVVDKRTFRADDREVRLTITRIIRDHLRPDAPISWQGHDLDFTGAKFDAGDFSSAVFSGGHVRFDDAEFLGGLVTFEDAKFNGAHVSFHGSAFSGGEVTFNGAEFSEGTVDFRGATFSGADVVFGGSKRYGRVLHARHSARFSGSSIDFAATHLSDGTLSFDGVEFTAGSMSFFGAVFSGGGLSFAGLQLKGADLSLGAADFAGARASFFGAQFESGRLNLSATFASGVVDFGEAEFAGAAVWLAGAKWEGGALLVNGSTVTSTDAAAAAMTQ